MRKKEETRESRAEQSRAEQSRAASLDVLKAICAFLVVCIHVPFPGKVGEYFTALTRVAVPIFFMITGFFHADVVLGRKSKDQIKKIFLLSIKANVIFLVWKFVYNAVKGKQAVHVFVLEAFSSDALAKFFLFNDNQVGPHLWYLSAILYVLIIVFLIDRLNAKKVLYYSTPILLLGDLVLGKYSLVFLGHEVPYYYVRNFLFVGLPYFSIGNIIRDRYSHIERIGRKWLVSAMVLFSFTTIAERMILVSVGKNAVRDHYLSTTFLAVSIFMYTLVRQGRQGANSNRQKLLAKIGREYSADIYIVHPIIITILQVVFSILGLRTIYVRMAPMIVYMGTIVVISVTRTLKRRLLNI